MKTIIPLKLDNLKIKVPIQKEPQQDQESKHSLDLAEKSYQECTYTGEELKLTANLYPFQQDYINWTTSVDKPVDLTICDIEMGLGKSIMLIAHCCAKAYKKILIIMPLAITNQFRDEWFKFTNIRPDQIVVYHGSGRNAVDLNNKRVIITNFDTVKIDMKNEQSQLYLIHNKLDMVAIDEAHTIRNKKTKLYLMCERVAQFCPNRWVMTGTVINNKYDDFKTLVSFLGLDEELKTTDLSEFKRKYYYHLTKKDVNMTIVRHEQKHVMKLTPDHQCYYDDTHSELIEFYSNKYNSYIPGMFGVLLTKILRLRQVCNHPDAILSSEYRTEHNLYKGGEIPVKFLKINEQLNKFPNDKFLVFSQWTYSMELLQEYLNTQGHKSLMYNGQMTQNYRQEIKKQFDNDPDIKIMLININAGGVGLNLVSANHVFILDSWWNHALEEQAINRVYRIGQTKEVYVHRMYIEDSIELWISKLKEEKTDVSNLFTMSDKPSLINQSILTDLLHRFI